MYKTIFTIVLAAMIALAAPAAAIDMQLGQETWGLDSFYDVRTYHESHPDFGKMGNRGGWAISLVFFGPNAHLVDKVIFSFDTGLEGNQMDVIYNDPMVYWWINEMNYDFLIFAGHKNMFGTTVTATILDNGGGPVDIIDHNGFNIGNVLSRDIPKDLVLPPIPVIKKNILLANGKCKLLFMFPYDENFSNLRIRIFQDPADGTGAEVQYRLNPDGSGDIDVIKEIIRQGVPVEDKLKAIIPADYQGREGRIEYRTNINGYTMRGIQYFKLPVAEAE